MSKILDIFHQIPMFFLVLGVGLFFTQSAHAGIEDVFNLAPFVPLVLQSMMNIATSLYKYFVGNGDGLIYIFIYVFMGGYLVLFLSKMYLPKDWLSFMGFSGGGEMWDGSATGWSITENVAKPCIRVLVAGLILLQIKPIYVTEWLVNPFLEFGSVYTESILKTVNNSSFKNPDLPVCPESVIRQGWISQRSCDFLVKPVFVISAENNRVIKSGLDFVKSGLMGMFSLVSHGGENILNIITGLLLISAFVSANVFMALLIIQAIFDFCLSLIMYPFNVLAWVAKKSDKWLDLLPPFNQIIDSLKKMVITMIACAFILCINIAVVHALFNWSTPEGGTINMLSSISFGQHFILWLSSILTFFLMQNIFKMTRERLDMYTKDTPRTLYNNVTGDAKTIWGKTKAAPNKIKNIWQTGKDIRNKIK